MICIQEGNTRDVVKCFHKTKAKIIITLINIIDVDLKTNQLLNVNTYIFSFYFIFSNRQ